MNNLALFLRQCAQRIPSPKKLGGHQIVKSRPDNVSLLGLEVTLYGVYFLYEAASVRKGYLRCTGRHTTL